jgi:hypothetical protein
MPLIYRFIPLLRSKAKSVPFVHVPKILSPSDAIFASLSADTFVLGNLSLKFFIAFPKSSINISGFSSVLKISISLLSNPSRPTLAILATPAPRLTPITSSYYLPFFCSLKIISYNIMIKHIS